MHESKQYKKVSTFQICCFFLVTLKNKYTYWLRVRNGYYEHCEKYHNFTWFPGVEILWKAQFPHSFGRIARNYAETMTFRKISTPGNQVKLRYFSQWKWRNFSFFSRWYFTLKLVNLVQCLIDISCLQILMVGSFCVVGPFCVFDWF